MYILLHTSVCFPVRSHFTIVTKCLSINAPVNVTPGQAAGGDRLSHEIVPRVGVFVKHKKALCMPVLCSVNLHTKFSIDSPTIISILRCRGLHSSIVPRGGIQLCKSPPLPDLGLVKWGLA